MSLKPTDLLGSLAKGLAVIESFSPERPRLSITEVAGQTGLDRATARRCLLTLTDLGYADYDGKFFRLTPRVLRLGTACLATMPLPSIVQPWLDTLSGEIRQSTSVSILDEWEIVYVARAAQQRLMAVNLVPGSRLPASCTSMGRVLLAELAEKDVRELMKRHPPVRRTERTIADTSRLIDILAKVREQGYALVDQETEIGLRSLAVPLHDAHGKVVAALNTGVAAIHDDPQELKDLYLEKLLSVQQAIKPLLV